MHSATDAMAQETIRKVLHVLAQTYTDEVVLTLFEMDEQSQRWVGSPGGRQAPGSADLLILKICPTFSTSKFLTWGKVIVPLILAYCRKFLKACTFLKKKKEIKSHPKATSAVT